MDEIKFYAYQILDATLKKGSASYAAADMLKELTGLSDEQLSDAVDYLEDQRAVKPLRGGEHYRPGVTLRFASIMVTTRGRMLYRELGEDIKPALILKEQSATVQLPSATRKLRVFLCHGKEDKVSVMGIYERLAEDGFEPWLDAKNLLPGQDWKQEITKAVRASDVVMVCLSHCSATKEGFVQREIKIALDVAKEKPSGTIFVIPLRLEDCDVPNELSDWHWADYYDVDGYDKLKGAMLARAKQLGLHINLDGVKIPPAQPTPIASVQGNLEDDSRIETPAAGVLETIKNNVRYAAYFRWPREHREILGELIKAGGTKHYDPNRDVLLLDHLYEALKMRFIERVAGSPNVTYTITELGRNLYREIE